MFNQEGGLWGSTAEGKLLTSAKIFTPQASKRLGMGDKPPVYLSSMRTCVPVHACRWASNLLFVPKGDTTPFYVLSHASWLWYNGETPFDSEKERPPSAFQSYRNGSKLAFLDGLRLEAGGLNRIEYIRGWKRLQQSPWPMGACYPGVITAPANQCNTHKLFICKCCHKYWFQKVQVALSIFTF